MIFQNKFDPERLDLSRKKKPKPDKRKFLLNPSLGLSFENGLLEKYFREISSHFLKKKVDQH